MCYCHCIYLFIWKNTASVVSQYVRLMNWFSSPTQMCLKHIFESVNLCFEGCAVSLLICLFVTMK